MNITYRKATINDAEIVTKLTLLLYNSNANTYESLFEENTNVLSNEKQAIFLAFNDKLAVGFAHCSIRYDYVEGTNGGNIGYLEGILVQPEYRLKKIASSLVELCNKWAKEKDCLEFASDCELINISSYNFHLKIGFKEANRIICFVKKL